MEFRKKVTIILYTTTESLQSCPTLWDPTDGSPPGSTVPGIQTTLNMLGTLTLAYSWAKSFDTKPIL